MKNMKGVGVILAVLLLVTGVVVFKAMNASKAPIATVPTDQQPATDVAQLDPSVTVTLQNVKAKPNTVVLTVSGLNSKMVSVGYEFSYDSNGLIKGVNSGSKPLDLTGKDTFDREVYLGTCSRNDCKPDAGVKKVTVSLEFTDSAGKKYQFSKDFDI
jgi:hypothetical protein